MQLAVFVLTGLIRNMMYKKLKSITEQNYTNLKHK